MPDTPATSLQDDLAEANLHRYDGDRYTRIARYSPRREYWLARASIAYALASVITLSMKGEGDG